MRQAPGPDPNSPGIPRQRTYRNHDGPFSAPAHDLDAVSYTHLDQAGIKENASVLGTDDYVRMGVHGLQQG